MFTNPVSKVFVLLLVLAVTFVSASFAVRSTNPASVDRSYDRLEQLRSVRSSAFHYDLIEQVRLGRNFNAPTNRSYDSIEGLRSLRSAVSTAYDQIETLRLQRGSHSLNIGSLYDLIEQVRLGRNFNAPANRSYDGIEGLRALRSAGTSIPVFGYDQIESLRIQRAVSPLAFSSAYDLIEQVRMQRNVSTVVVNSGYDLIEQLRTNRGPVADRSYDPIEELRLQP